KTENILQLQLNEAAPHLRRNGIGLVQVGIAKVRFLAARTARHRFPALVYVDWAAVAAKTQALAGGEEVALDRPFTNRIDHAMREPNQIPVLDDAADPNVRQRKRLGSVLDSPSLDYDLFKGLVLELHDRAIRVDGARIQLAKRFIGPHGDLDVCVLPS